MKIITLLALLLLLAVSSAYSDPPKSGQSLGTITTTDGKAYADAKLAAVEPDGISILYADGGAKIAFTSLSPEMQKQFGYDPEKSAFYAREQQYLAQIDKLQQENAVLRKRLNLAAAEPEAAKTAQQTQPTVAGFHYYFKSLQNQSKGMKIHSISKTSGSIVFSGGPLEGMTQDQAQAYAQQQWASLPLDQQMACEKSAQFYGDPIAKQEELDRISAAHPHPSGATVQGSDGTSYNVQYH
jgi:hypothetical protein